MCAHRNGKTGAATKEAAGEAGALHHVEHNHTQTHHKTHEHTKHTGLLHSQPFSYTHSAFSAFIRRDGCVSQG